MKSSEKRSRKYKAKIKGQVLPGQKVRYMGAVPNQVQAEISIKNILTQHGVMVGLNHFYMVFGKKALQLTRRFTGPTLMVELEGLDTLWENRGLDATILGLIKENLVPGYLPCGPFTLDASLLDSCDYLV